MEKHSSFAWLRIVFLCFNWAPNGNQAILSKLNIETFPYFSSVRREESKRGKIFASTLLAYDQHSKKRRSQGVTEGLVAHQPTLFFDILQLLLSGNPFTVLE